MSQLTKFRDYARVMAQDGHTDDCIASTAEAERRWGYFLLFREWPSRWGARPSGEPKPCGGDCVTDADRALFAQLAAEVDEYLSPQVDLFGEESVEPTVEEVER